MRLVQFTRRAESIKIVRFIVHRDNVTANRWKIAFKSLRDSLGPVVSDTSVDAVLTCVDVGCRLVPCKIYPQIEVCSSLGGAMRQSLPFS